MTPTVWKWLRRLGFLVLGLWGPYLLAVNLYLNTSLAPRTINRKPEQFQIHWNWGWSLWPGITYLNNIEARGQSRKIQWYVRLDSVITTYKIIPLFDRVVELDWVRAKGIDYRQRRRVQPGVDPDRDIRTDPPIPGFTNPPDPDPQKLYPKKPHKAPWTILANRIECDLQQIWIEGLRIAGETHVDMSMSLKVRGALAFPDVKFKSTSADLWIGSDSVFEDLKMDLDLRVDPFVPKQHKGPDLMQFISGQIGLNTGSASLHVLGYYFRNSPWLSFDGRGSLEMVLRLDKGVLQPGSIFELVREEGKAQFLDQEITGSGHVKAEVVLENGTSTSRMQIFTDKYQITELGKSEPYIQGNNFSIVATSTHLGLLVGSHDLEIKLDMPESEILDLSFYNTYIPEKISLSIESGVGTLRYHFIWAQEDQDLHGEIVFTANDLVVNFEGNQIMGDMRIVTQLKHGNAQEQRFDISGTRVEFKSNQFNWDGVFSFPKSKMRFNSPMEIDAEVDFEMQDTRPIVALFDARYNVPRWVLRLMTIKDVNGGAAFKMEKDLIEVKDLEITGNRLRVLADLSISEGTHDGVMYIRFRGFSLGIELTKGKKKLKFNRPLRWFNKRRAERGGEAAAE